MKSVSIRYIGLFFALPAIILLAVSCKGDTTKAAATAKAFLQAYYVDLDFDRAKSLCSDNSKAAVAEQAEMVALNPYAKDEVPDIVFKQLNLNANNPNTAVFIYTVNRAERSLPLRKFNKIWLVDLQGGTVEMGGNLNRIELGSDVRGGFAASQTSGPVVYKKRKKRN